MLNSITIFCKIIQYTKYTTKTSETFSQLIEFDVGNSKSDIRGNEVPVTFQTAA